MVVVYFSAEVAPIQSYKNALQEWCADKKHRLPAPVYKTVSESGPDHKRIYERAVYVGDRLVATGKGKNQKIADSAAAEAALEILKSENQPKKEINLDSITKLKALAVKNKQPSPEFRDLGESEKSTPASREFVIECRLMGKSACAMGNSKQEARAKAAEKLLSIFDAENAPAKMPKRKNPPVKQKKAAKPSVKTKNARKSEKSASPKKQAYQHKKHL